MSRNSDWQKDISIAMELCYSNEVIDKLEEEPNWKARQRILKDARHGKYPGIHNRKMKQLR